MKHSRLLALLSLALFGSHAAAQTPFAASISSSSAPGIVTVGSKHGLYVRYRNQGTATWNPGELYFVGTGGNSPYATHVVKNQVIEPVLPQQWDEFGVWWRAPELSTYRYQFRLYQGPSNTTFGTALDGSGTVRPRPAADISVWPPPNTTIEGWYPGTGHDVDLDIAWASPSTPQVVVTVDLLYRGAAVSVLQPTLVGPQTTRRRIFFWIPSNIPPGVYVVRARSYTLNGALSDEDSYTVKSWRR